MPTAPTKTAPAKPGTAKPSVAPAAPKAAQTLATAPAAKTAPAKPSSTNPLWYSMDGTPIRVPLPDGRVAIVGKTPRTLPRAFFKEAAKQGCLTTAMDPAAFAPPASTEVDDPIGKHKAIVDLIVEAAHSEEGAEGFETAFTNTGLPDHNWLGNKLDMEVTFAERDSAWDDAQKILEAEEEALRNQEQLNTAGETQS